MTKEEKDKLIELSDLNREDNIKYISSEAQGIAITLDSDRFAPSMCKLERAYICGRRKSENRISELEEENAELKTVKIPQLERRIASIRGAHSVDCRKLNLRREQVERLKKENAELKILISSMLYEINALWDISEMNEDVRKHAERIGSEVSK